MSDDPHTIAPLIWLVSALAVVAGLLVLADWRDPCRGQITDLLGCYAASVEADQADQADQGERGARQPVATTHPDAWFYEIEDEWRACAEGEVGADGQWRCVLTNADAEAQYCLDFPEDAACNGTDDP